MLLSRVTNNIAVYKEKHQIHVLNFLMSRAMRNCALGKMRQRGLRSACAYAKSDHSLCCPYEASTDPRLCKKHRMAVLMIEQTDDEANEILHWVDMSEDAFADSGIKNTLLVVYDYIWFEKPLWCQLCYSPHKPGVVVSIRGFSRLSDESLNRGPVSVWP